MAPRTARRCPHCDTAIEPSATFCSHCGNTLPALGATQMLPPTRTSVPRGSPLLWVITIAVLGVVLGLVGVLWSRVASPATVGMITTIPTPLPSTGSPELIPTTTNTPITQNDPSGDWRLKVHVYRNLDQTGQTSEVDSYTQIMIRLFQKGTISTGEYIGASGACSKATIEGTIQNGQIKWVINYIGSCCRDSKMEFEGVIKIDGTIEGNLKPLKVSDNCIVWWADVVGIKE